MREGQLVFGQRGSSPRGRGTPLGRSGGAVEHRFIPARAGNAAKRLVRATGATVHPRAGGERQRGPATMCRFIGSSPRGRGTPRHLHAWRPPDRFIPARAGNAGDEPWKWLIGTVHPRAGGERPCASSRRRSAAASSPRGRGTPVRVEEGDPQLRFIPARAGNAPARVVNHGRHPVHPRAGGERYHPAQTEVPVSGSSPRGRGTRRSRPYCRFRLRFIPARAGNACRCPTPRAPASVHPRAGGERGRGRRLPGRLQRFIPARAGNASTRRARPGGTSVHPRAGGERAEYSASAAASSGSSPRGRGTHRRGHRGRERLRFIPARAGNAAMQRSATPQGPVHPRAGGERLDTRCCGAFCDGSSPRGRGTLIHQPISHVRMRFIPARAGNARRPQGLRGRRPVHPRAGGERLDATAETVLAIGSSPRGRGTRFVKKSAMRFHRFIPARAGNASRSRTSPSHTTVHPRAGGERIAASTVTRNGVGSSPRGRGTLPAGPHLPVVRRFIPARAGNAAGR